MRRNIWIITRISPTDTYSNNEFWTGSTWSKEMPDAAILGYREAFDWCRRHRPAQFSLFRYSDYLAGNMARPVRPNHL
jgi:hypothetical protein